MQVLIENERKSRWLNLSVSLILIAIVVIDVSAYLKPDAGSMREKARVARLIDGWLKEQKEGGEGLSFWSSSEGVEPMRFHEVRSWKTIQIEPFECALVRVDSLSEAGYPNSQVWKVHVGTNFDGTRVITKVMDPEELSPPPPSLVKRQESLPARKVRLEKEAALAKLAGLSQKINELENETDRKLTRLDNFLIQERL